MMERFSPSYSENRVILIVNQCQARLTLAGVLGMPSPAGHCVPGLGAALSLCIQSGPVSPAFSRPALAFWGHFSWSLHHPSLFLLLGPPFPARDCRAQPRAWIHCDQQVLAGPGCNPHWHDFFVLQHAVHYSSPTPASGYTDFRWI